MADRLSPERRSANMARIRSKNTKPELAVRRAAHALGFRFRLHREDLPGKPDLVFPGRRAIIFVHGCFWHRHAGCQDCSAPKSRREYWEPKFAATVARDAGSRTALESTGWRVLTIWDCETVDAVALKRRLWDFLGSTQPRSEANHNVDADRHLS